MKVALLDPGLTDCAGHHLDMDIRLIRELTSRGHEVKVFSHQSIDAKAMAMMSALSEVVPKFRVSPYRNPAYFEHAHLLQTSDPLSGDLAYLIDGASIIAEDLVGVEGFDKWLWPSIYPAHVLACAMHAKSAPVFACLHAEPNFHTQFGGQFWRYAFNHAMAAEMELKIGALTPELASVYSQLFPEIRVQLLPSYIGGVVEHAPKTQLRRIGFFGHQQRFEKGYALIAQLSNYLLESGYAVTVQDSGNSFKSGDHPQLEVLGHIDDIGQEIRRCDLVVVPYSAEAYRLKGSGIVWEAVANGVPLVAPADTAPGRLIAAMGVGGLFNGATAEEILKAIRATHADYQIISLISHAAAIRWNRSHGIRPFLDEFMNAQPTSAAHP